jgi:hypothetical protein
VEIEPAARAAIQRLGPDGQQQYEQADVDPPLDRGPRAR